MDIIIPELNTLSSLKFAADINKIDFASVDEVNFVADMKWVRPFGMIMAATAMKHLRHRHPSTPFRLLCDTNRNGISYAAHMGFFKTISESISIGNAPGEATGNDNYLPITHLDIVELQRQCIASGRFQEIGDTIEQKSAELAKIICRNNIEMQALMTYLIREILRNIPEHADSDKAWICGQYWADGTAEIAIVDEGIGIKTSLQKMRFIVSMYSMTLQHFNVRLRLVFLRHFILVEAIVLMMFGLTLAMVCLWQVRYVRNLVGHFALPRERIISILIESRLIAEKQTLSVLP